MDTKPPVITRLEHSLTAGKHSPSLAMLKKMLRLIIAVSNLHRKPDHWENRYKPIHPSMGPSVSVAWFVVVAIAFTANQSSLTKAAQGSVMFYKSMS